MGHTRRVLLRPGVCFVYLLVTAMEFLHAGAADVVVNEILYHPDPDNTGGEFVEVFNSGDTTVDISGWKLVDAVSFAFPAGTILDPGAFVVVARRPQDASSFYQLEDVYGPYLGRLNNAGENVILRDESGQEIDSVPYDDRPPWPAEADGSGTSLELIDATSANIRPESWGLGAPFSPGAPNAPVASDSGAVVITEIMAKPLRQERRQKLDRSNHGPYIETGDDEFGEFVELYNRSGSIVDLSGWTFSEGIDYRFEDGTQLEPNAYLVVAAAPVFTKARFDIENVVGPFSLDLRDGGERITLRDHDGQVVDSVRYNDRHPWPIAPDEIGASLECVSPLDENSTAANWRSSVAEFPQPQVIPPEDGWRRVLLTGSVGSSRLVVSLSGPGEWLIDELEIVPLRGGENIVPNGSFDSGDDTWEIRGNHSETFWTAGEGREGTGGERVVSSGRGSLSNSVWTKIEVEGIKAYRLTAWAKHLSGEASLSIGLLGFDLDATLDAQPTPRPAPPLDGTTGSATPGRANSVLADGVPPLVERLRHFPDQPTSADDVSVTATVTATAPIASVELGLEILRGTRRISSIDPVAMFDDGEHDDGAANDGIFGVRVEAQESQTLVHYWVRAEDVDGRVTVFPYNNDPAPAQAYFHSDNDVDTEMTMYYLFVSPQNLQRLDRNPRSLDYLDCSLVIDDRRPGKEKGPIVYPHISTRHRGRSSRSDPRHQWKFKFNRNGLYDGNRGLDTQLCAPLMQRMVFATCDQAGISNLDSDVVRLHLNGKFWQYYVVFENPNSTWVRKHGYGNRTEVYKARSVQTLQESKNTDLFRNEILTDFEFWGAWNKKLRPLEPPSHIRELVHALNDLSDRDLLPWLDANVNIEQVFTRWGLYIVNNVDDFTGHNYYLLRPEGGKWQWLGYDFDSVSRQTSGDLWLTYGDGIAINVNNGGNPAWQRNKLLERVSQNKTLRRVHALNMRRMINAFYREDIIHPVLDDIDARADDEIRSSGPLGLFVEVLKEQVPRQRRNLGAQLSNEGLPGEEAVPKADPPGGTFNVSLEATLSTPEGWQAVFTTDGSDPRLSTTAILYEAPIAIEATTAIRAASIATRNGRPTFSSGDWTDVAEERYELLLNAELYIRGDFSLDGRVNLTDVIQLLGHLFRSRDTLCKIAGDVNDDEKVSIDDVLSLLNYLYRRGPEPPAPFPAAGVDPDGEAPLGCDQGITVLSP